MFSQKWEDRKVGKKFNMLITPASKKGMGKNVFSHIYTILFVLGVLLGKCSPVGSSLLATDYELRPRGKHTCHRSEATEEGGFWKVKCPIENEK
ncbi:MAG: hypothetical protein AB7E08_06615 [Candidatus Omnitrophota bacterium]